MRATLRDLEALAAVPFVLVTGTLGGLLLCLGEVVQPRGAAVLAVGLLVLATAALVCWIGMRRRRYSVWSTALQLTVAAILAQLIAIPVVIAMLFEGPGPRQLQWHDVVVQMASAQLAMSPLAFALALVLVAAGRAVPGHGQHLPSHHATDATESLDRIT